MSPNNVNLSSLFFYIYNLPIMIIFGLYFQAHYFPSQYIIFFEYLVKIENEWWKWIKKIHL